jgi:hypothetical protein
MNSFINLFIYEVKGPNSISHHEPKGSQPLNYYRNVEYSFNKLSLKNNTDSNNSVIIPKELKKIGYINSNKDKLFSKNIIKNKNKNNNEEINIRLNNLPFLYKIYKTLPARITAQKILNTNISLTQELKNNIYNKLIKLIQDNTNIFKSYLKKYSAYKSDNDCNNLYNDSEIIYDIYEDDKSKIILIGDNHGSFHSFFRIILRLYINGIISSNYTLKKDYKLILLGDLVDRGNYGIELLYIILNLMYKNNTDNNLRVILIRGNHEVEEIYKRNGFFREFKTKVSDPNIDYVIRNFFKYCPSAIVLNHLYTRYWLCHGGFPINFIKDQKTSKYFNFFKKTPSLVNNIKPKMNNKNEIIYKKITDKVKSYNKNPSIFINNIRSSSEIRWNDFNGLNNTDCSKRDRCKETMHVIGNKDLLKFLNYMNINFIIRGHTDDYSNAMLLINVENNEGKKNNPYFYINNMNSIKYYQENINELNNIFDYKIKRNSSKSENEIVSINPKKFNKNEVTVGNLKLLPVLTISNNSDNSRMQYSDSFLIITNNGTNQNNNLIPNSNRNSILSSNNEDWIYSNNKENNLSVI